MAKKRARKRGKSTGGRAAGTGRKKTRSTRTAAASSARPTGYRLSEEKLEEALLAGQEVELLESYFGEEAYRELAGLASRAKRRGRSDGPVVLILPGLMGSKLGKSGTFFDDTLWFDPFDVMRGNLSRLALGGTGRSSIAPLGVILFSYLRLKLELCVAGFNAKFCAFDWRQGLDHLGQKLTERIDEETQGKSSRAVYLVAHSMGGLVARSALAQLGDRGQLVRKLIMLGTPNFGSFVPVQALRGEYGVVRKVAALDLHHSAEELAEQVFGTFPGLYQMLPFREKFSEVDLYDAEAWPTDAPRPAARLLAAAPAVQQSLASGDERFVLIAGVGQETVVGLRREGGEFVFLLSEEGDGTVPLEFARLPGVRTYFVDETHGSLPNNRLVERAVIELLESNQTSVLPTHWIPNRSGVTQRVRAQSLAAEPFAGRSGKELAASDHRKVLEELVAPLERAVEAPMGLGTAMRFHGTSAEPIVVGRRRQTRIDLHLAHGSITQIDTRAIVLGLFRDVEPAGAATAVDEALDGAITEFTKRRMFTGRVGEIFVLPAGQQRLRADMVVFVGLGAFDQFDEEVLRLAAENLTRTLIRTKVSDFATVLIGAGSVTNLRDSLASLLEGCFSGILDSGKGAPLRSITLCEMGKLRYQQLRSEVLSLATTELFDEIEVTVDEVPVPSEAVFRTEPAESRIEAQYLIVRQESREDGELALRSSLLTPSTKATVISDIVRPKSAKLDALLKEIDYSNFTAKNLDDYGRRLGELVLPKSVLAGLAHSREHPLVLVHDAETARIPWETLCIDKWFPASEPGLTRKYSADNLSVAKWLNERRLGASIDLLLVVNPTKDLAGADLEGERVRKIFGSNPLVRITLRQHEDATWNALRADFRSGKFDVVHYAGHAMFDPQHRERSGILCHGGKVLSGADLAGLSNLPALVYFNACESGRVRGGKPQAKKAAGGKGQKTEGTTDRIDRTVGLAEAFMRGGVANYIGTYWPVGDAAAAQFAEAFYVELVGGATIGAALSVARNRVRGQKDVDWANFIHYGSPNFVLKERDPK